MRNPVICLVLAAMTWLVYWPVHRFDFVNYDDEAYVYENKHVEPGLTWKDAAWAWKSTEAANYFPLTWLSLMLDSTLFGVQPAGFHVENVLLHTLNVLLLFAVLKKATNQTWPPAFVAAIFAVHPVHVESVAWVTERKDVLSTAFLMLTIFAYLAYAKANIPAKKRLFYTLTIIFMACGLLSKPLLVTLPFLLLLLDCWPLRRNSGLKRDKGTGEFRLVSWRAALVEKIPLFGLSLASCIVTYIVQHAGGAVISVERISFGQRAGNVFISYVRYIGKSLWPIDLSPFYPYRTDWSAFTVAASVVLIVGLTGLFFAVVRRFPYLIVGWLWFLGSLVPMIGIVQVGDQSIADRYLYVPLIGLAIMIAWGGAELSRWSKASVGGLAVLALATAAIVARHQLLYWHDTRTLFNHALDVTKDNAIAHLQLAYLDDREGNIPSAIDHYNQAIRFAPDDYVADFDLANMLLRTDPAQAIEHYRSAAEKNPRLAKIQNNWGKALIDLSRPGEAFDHFKEAVRIDPDYLDAHYALGQMLFSAGFYDQAKAEFETALRIDPDFAGARRGLEAIKGVSPGH